MAILLTAPFIGIHLLTPVQLPWGMLAFLCSLPGLIGALLALKAYQRRRHDAFAPSLTMTSHGLELRRNFRRNVRMEFADITRVVAVSGLDGGGESTMTLVLYSSGRRIAIGGELLFGSSLLARLEKLPGFDSQAYAGSWVEENGSNQAFFSKRTVIFRQAIPQVTVRK
ncbi:hypothetical protein ACQ859_17125 [Roseateles chitinivorans]|uniref:hypothetical protein n=1 Tax=Roseateles chitinivorans TaxID=2917965 RepID=UPI003D665536